MGLILDSSVLISAERRGETVAELLKQAFAVAGVAGLSRSSVAVCHQVTTLDRAKLTKLIGTLPLNLLEEVEQGLRAALDLD